MFHVMFLFNLSKYQNLIYFNRKSLMKLIKYSRKTALLVFKKIEIETQQMSVRRE